MIQQSNNQRIAALRLYFPLATRARATRERRGSGIASAHLHLPIT
ncbi:hypothetical protein BSU04_31810 [Caballeronia sordidicola]|uniref:Uncharacterized protein n=1 Tax=Caballeronia sordidicola TaxID=196367 RepID=A0A226WTD4_CABSO|nr:hypothetical protein BSU04_31810 [Caballeronia sordidicola]